MWRFLMTGCAWGLGHTRRFAFGSASASFALALGLAGGAGAQPQTPQGVVEVTISGERSHPVDDRLFGLEVDPADYLGRGADGLDADAVERLASLRPPILRQPAGSVPAGLNGEALAGAYVPLLNLADLVGASPVLSIRLADVLEGRMPMRDAARRAAGVVAFTNVDAGAERPDWLDDWPALREQFGRDEPWGVRYWVIGGRADYRRLYREALRITSQSDVSPAEWAVRLLRAHADAMRAVDDSAVMMLPVWAPRTQAEGAFMLSVLSDERLRRRFQYLVVPGDIGWGWEIGSFGYSWALEAGDASDASLPQHVDAARWANFLIGSELASRVAFGRDVSDAGVATRRLYMQFRGQDAVGVATDGEVNPNGVAATADRSHLYIHLINTTDQSRSHAIDLAALPTLGHAYMRRVVTPDPGEPAGITPPVHGTFTPPTLNLTVGPESVVVVEVPLAPTPDPDRR